MTIQETLWLLFGGLIGGVVACGVAYAFIGIERLSQIRRANVGLAPRNHPSED